MLEFLTNFRFERVSFWLGFLAGILFWWFQARLRAYFNRIRVEAKEYAKTARRGLESNIEIRYRNDLLRKAQRSHLTAMYFSLDEILITPRIIAPPPQTQPGSESPDLGFVTNAISYLPDWPELAAVYNAPTLNLVEALSGGANLLLLGHPGTGKTVALAYFASLLARHNEEAGEFKDYLPILVQASDILVAAGEEEDLLKIVTTALSEYVSTFALTRLPTILRGALEKGTAMLLVDGVDELAPESINMLSAFIGAFLYRYPQVRMIVAASPDYYDGLTVQDLLPVAIATWDSNQKTAFIQNWNFLWEKYIANQIDEENEPIDPMLTMGWLMDPDPSATPFDFTLKTWAAFAGDIQGSSVPDSIEAYLLRMTAGTSKARPALEKLASQMLFNLNPAITLKEAQKSIPVTEMSVSPFDEEATSFTEESLLEIPTENRAEVNIPSPEAEIGMATSEKETTAFEPEDDNPPFMSETPFITDALESSDGKKPSSKPQQKTGPLHQVIPDMLERGLLVSHIGSRLSFMHPVIAGYLAGTALASSGDLERVKNQPNWSGKNLALRYFAYWNDMTDLVTPELERLDDPLLRDFLTICRWIRISPKSANWRPTALRQVAVLLQREVFPVSIRARLMIALVTSGDPGAPILLRQNLKNPLSSLRQISALGCGMLKDTKSIEDLTILIEDPDPQVSSAALLALVSIGNKLALDAVAGTLLTSSEDKRRAAAEALANHAEEGHPALEEGSGMEDIMVRRAVVYGLARVSKPSALEKIEKLQVEDQQWVVRSAATQVIEILKGPNPYAPRRLPSLTQLPWLIVFAGKQGIGVAPGEPAKELLLQALRSEDTNERLAAMEYCALKGDVSAVPTIYQYFYGGDTQLREAASNTLWHMAAMGVHLPPPTQYGLG